jgi:hypothetical protein
MITNEEVQVHEDADMFAVAKRMAGKKYQIEEKVVPLAFPIAPERIESGV